GVHDGQAGRLGDAGAGRRGVAETERHDPGLGPGDEQTSEHGIHAAERERLGHRAALLDQAVSVRWRRAASLTSLLEPPREATCATAGIAPLAPVISAVRVASSS